jgi:hypothetical protein
VLDGREATAAGVLLAATGTSDIADGHVILGARAKGEPIVTTNPDDLAGLDPHARRIVV